MPHWPYLSREGSVGTHYTYPADTQIGNFCSPISRHTELLLKKITTLKLSFRSASSFHKWSHWRPRRQVAAKLSLDTKLLCWPCGIPTQLGNSTVYSEHDETSFEIDYLTTPHSNHFHLSHLAERRIHKGLLALKDGLEVWNPWDFPRPLSRSQTYQCIPWNSFNDMMETELYKTMEGSVWEHTHWSQLARISVLEVWLRVNY